MTSLTVISPLKSTNVRLACCVIDSVWFHRPGCGEYLCILRMLRLPLFGWMVGFDAAHGMPSCLGVHRTCISDSVHCDFTVCCTYRCLLGVILREDWPFEKAWEVSGGKYAKAQICLGQRCFGRGDVPGAIKHFKVRLTASQGLHRTQDNATVLVSHGTAVRF